VSHRKAVLTPIGRLTLVERIALGRPAAHVASEMGVSRATTYKWWHRYVREGEAGLCDRSSRPLHSPRRTPARVERQIVVLRRRTKLGPIRIAIRLQMPASTMHRVLVRRHLNRLSWMDRPTGRVIRRYEHEHPGDLIHVDVKKLGRIPPGGGWRMHGRLGHHSPGSAATTSILRWTIIHGSPTRRSAATNAVQRPLRSGPAPRRSLPLTASRSNACSPTMPLPTGTRSPFTRWPRAVPCNGSSSRAGLRPMARWSASTARCSRNGRTFAPTPQTSDGPRP